MARLLTSILLLATCAASVAAQSNMSPPLQSPTPAAADPCVEISAQVAQAETMLRDWPFLARYSEANAGTALPAKGEQRVVFMGDSITDLMVRSIGDSSL